MIANSTNISNRMFRSQRFVILLIVTMFTLLLIITSLAGHHEKVIQGAKALAEQYNSHGGTKLPSADKSDIEMELAAEEEEEEDRLRQQAEKAKAEAQKKGDGKVPQKDTKAST